jgi:Outer membrane protein beta-barrel domain
MRKIIFVSAIIFIAVNLASAQSTRFGFYVGPVAANMFEKVGGKGHSHGYVLGTTIGVLLDVPMQKHGSFQPGLNYIGKNSKDNFKSGGDEVNTRTTLNYIEVPINVLFKLPFRNGNITLGTGVAAAMALDGKSRIKTSGSKEDKKLGFGDETTDDLGKYDFGINALAGYEFKNGFFVTLNYNYGISRLFVGGDPDDKLYSRYFALRFGFLLGGKK